MEQYVMRDLPQHAWILLEVQHDYVFNTGAFRKGDITWITTHGGWDYVDCYHPEYNRWWHNFPKSIFKELCRGTGTEKTKDVLATMKKHIFKRDSAPLIQEAKARYPEGTFVYQLYTDGTTNFRKEIKIAHHSLITIDPLDGEVLYDVQWRLKASGCWALVVETREEEWIPQKDEWCVLTDTKLSIGGGNNTTLKKGDIVQADGRIEKGISYLHHWIFFKGQIDAVKISLLRKALPHEIPQDAESKAVEVDMKAILEEAKRRYPIGTVFKNFDGHATHTVSSELIIQPDYDKGISHLGIGFLYKDGKWAEIVSLPEKAEPESLVDRYVKALQDNAACTPYKKGEYIKLVRKNRDWYYCAKDKMILQEKHRSNDLFELMPKAFSPGMHEQVDNLDYSVKGKWYQLTTPAGMKRDIYLKAKFRHKEANTLHYSEAINHPDVPWDGYNPDMSRCKEKTYIVVEAF